MKIQSSVTLSSCFIAPHVQKTGAIFANVDNLYDSGPPILMCTCGRRKCHTKDKDITNKAQFGTVISQGEALCCLALYK